MELPKSLMTLSLLLALISGCASTPEVVKETVYVPVDIPVKERPEGIDLYPVEFYVVTAENLEEFVEKFQATTGDAVFVALSVPHYENMSLNLAELRRYIEAQQAVIVYYETRVQEDINKPASNPTQE